jgi:hypothetical protein
VTMQRRRPSGLEKWKLLRAACSRRARGSPSPCGPDRKDAVDPTLPSWAPHSCKAYHAAVIHLAGCTQVAQDVRDRVAAKYDADNKSWHDMQNATQADLDQVKLACGDEARSVKAQLTNDCAAGVAEQPVAATK